MADFSIPQVQVPNMAALYQEGQQVGRQNALTAAMQQYGSAAVMGDQNALAAIAQFDPQAALGLMSGRQQMDLRERADSRDAASHGWEGERHEQSIAQGSQAMEIARQRAREATEAHAVNLTADKREQAIQKAGILRAFERVQTPEEWDAQADMMEMPELKGQFEQRDALVGMAMGITDALAEPDEGTEDIQEYGFAVQQGFQGTLQDWLAANRQRNVTVPPPMAGYRYNYDDNSNPVSAEPIPGTPAAREAALAEQAFQSQSGRRDTATDVIMGAAKSARDLIGRTSTGIVGQGMSMIGQTDAAEIERQVSVLKSNATIENLQAMRSSSPTGAGLGNVTQQENQMLAAAAGALDPSAGPNRFREALDNYERTLLRIVHGPEEGDRLFAATRDTAGTGSGATGSGVQWRLID
jgi:hypothetical protein